MLNLVSSPFVYSEKGYCHYKMYNWKALSRVRWEFFTSGATLLIDAPGISQNYDMEKPLISARFLAPQKSLI